MIGEFVGWAASRAESEGKAHHVQRWALPSLSARDAAHPTAIVISIMILIAASAAEPQPKNLSNLIARGNFPTRVHVVEDYDTDIEKRWWMAGKLETQDVPPGGRRACRATLTNDFDEKMGDRSIKFKAVIFNPVPGPPMGP